MNFKEIQLVGFKSFADKTSIKFDDGVTCIVGPNGCGKSNVADAVRWVLGEQSAKTLRGSSMQDVIFGGTQTRRQLSYCEVTLVFDNAERLFDIEYEEVAMTRRLYRSGESEYLLNKQPCRLKDIVALLHGVGIGKEGYSIIGQGKVEQIMNAKPEDRRAIFEEATGVMAFKARKGEIERKLENAKDNLTVFVQRMDETEKQLKPLERQAETAKKFRSYSEELKYEEVNTYLLRCENAIVETDRYRGRMQRASERIGQIDDELVKVNEEETSVRERIYSSDEELKDLNGKRLKYEVGLEHKSGEARLIAERIRRYGDDLRKAGDNVAYAQRRSAELDQDITGYIKRTEKNARRMDELGTERAALVLKLEEADARVAAYENIAREKRERELSSVEDLSKVRADRGKLSARRDAASERIEEVRNAIEKEEFKWQEFSAQLTACVSETEKTEEFLKQGEEKRETLSEEIRDLSLSEQKISREVAECDRSISNLKNNLEMYQDLKNRFNGYKDSVRRLQLTAKNDPSLGSRIKGAIADIVSTDQKYEVAIETAFGGAMQNLVTATADDARYLIEFLKRSGGGIVTFLPVSAMRPHYNSREITHALNETGALGLADELVKYDPYYDNIIKNLLGNTLVCDTIANATAIAKKFPRAFKLVTLDGDTIATSGAMTGGSRRRDSGNLLAGERNIHECEEGIALKTATMEKLNKALAERAAERAAAEESLERLRTQLQESSVSLAALRQRKSALEGLIADTEKDLNDYRLLLDTLTNTVNSLENEYLSSSESEDVLNKIRSAAAEELSAQNAEAEKLRAELGKLRARSHELEIEIARLTAENAANVRNKEDAEREKTNVLEQVERTRAQMAETETLIQQLKRDEELAALSKEEQEQVATIRARIAEVEEEKRTLSERQVEIGKSKNEFLSEQQTLSDTKYKCEVEITKIETGLENWKQRISEAYDLTYETAKELRDENYDITQSYANINSLKHKIAALGPINQNAEEDYDNLFTRYSEMQTQKNDLDKGILDLTGVLDELKGEMQKKFDEGFNAINSNFTHIFKELFGGGKAEMQLDYENCDDPLNAGVEIVACPPGKKLTKISLLSGGERAFTAIAILFAILKSRPMPFCILDEIEAALDEANVDRFAKYLKKFSKETQFVVITHRKPTMNQADCLFGVTMEEKGVSKIVSVKLSEVEAKLGGDTVIA